MSEDLGILIAPSVLRVYRRSATATGSGEPNWGPLTFEPMLRPAALQWGINGRATTLTLERCLGAGPGQSAPVTPEQAFAGLSAADEIRLVDDEGNIWFMGHVGQQSLLIQAGPDAQQAAVTAYGPELRLAGLSVHGQWSKTSTTDELELTGNLTPAEAVRANTFLADLPAVFNAEGRPNASQSTDLADQPIPWLLTSRAELSGVPGPAGRGCRVFEPPGRRVNGPSTPVLVAEHWTAYTALRSLVEYVDNYTVISPRTDWVAIKALLDNVVLGQTVVEGMDLCQAIRAVLLPAGFGFCLSPWPDSVMDPDGRRRHLLYVFSLHPTTEVGTAPILADNTAGPIRMDDPLARVAQIQRLELLRDAHRVANEIRVIGDRRRMQVCLQFHETAATRDLHPAWDTAVHDLATWAIDGVIPEMESAQYGGASPPDPQQFIARYGRGGSEHMVHLDVYRTFVWNEDGAYSPLAPVRPDLSSLLGADCWARRPRPLGPTLLRPAGADAAGALPAYVEIGIVGDDDAWILLPEARVLHDRAGFTVTAGRLDRFYPYHRAPAALAQLYAIGEGRYSFATLLYNTLRGATGPTDYKLRFRLIGTIAADEAVNGEAPYDTDSAWPIRATRTLYMPQRFAYASLADGANPDGLPARLADDALAATAHAAAVRQASLDAMGHGSMVLRHLTKSYRPGMAFRQTGGRPVDLTVGPGVAPAMAGVVGVRWTFEQGANKTELLLDSTLVGM